jgi:hypothetical protein
MVLPRELPLGLELDPGRVKTLRGITAPGILRLVVTLRAKKCKNSSSAQRYNQIRFRFHTAWTQSGHSLAWPQSTTGRIFEPVDLGPGPVAMRQSSCSL